MSAPTRQDWIAPTYLLTNIGDFIESITYRMLADGMILQDIRAAGESVTDWRGWCPFWMERAELHEGSGDAALERGHELTAGEHYARASLCAHYGQFLYFAFPDVKKQAVELKARLFEKAAPLIRPAAERIEIPFDGQQLPAYLRLPTQGDLPFPCVVNVGGLDAAKEDAYQFTSLCTARGLATLAFDGPGQGEAFYRGILMGDHFTVAISDALDYLETRQEIDQQRLGVIGRSTGGFLAPKAAAIDKRIKACAVWGAMYDLALFDDMPPLIIDGFQFVTKSRNPDEAREAMRFVNLAGFAKEISCPLYVLHGGKDNITPLYNATRMIEEASGETELALYENSIHCNHDVAHIARPAMADWLAQTLGAGRPVSR
jgi:2,6-dihydroxypseudooxynicotine hydrolase